MSAACSPTTFVYFKFFLKRCSVFAYYSYCFIRTEIIIIESQCFKIRNFSQTCRIAVFDTLVKTLNDLDWTFDKYEDKLIITSGVKGDDIPINFIVKVNPKNEVVQFLSKLPFNMPEDKRVDGALAVCAANYTLIDGSFVYDIRDGEILFKMTSSYRGSIFSENVIFITKDLFEYMIMVAASTIDKYNDKFLMIAKGRMTIQQFIEQANA